jgi:radical SAM superfamily enzyme YgiQ (UPF0313 family)
VKVQLINSPQGIGQDSSGFEFLYPPLGLLYLASYSRKHGGAHIEFKFTDGLLIGMEQALKEVVAFKPDIVAVSFTTSACEGAYVLIQKVKEISKDILVVTGGPHSTAMPDEVMARSEADICVMGEGEQTFAEIVRSIALKDIKGIVYRANGAIVKNAPRELITNLDDIPFPARDLIEDWSIYKGYYLSKRKPDMVMLSSRGCPYQCIFCSNPVWKLTKPHFRIRSPKNIVAELRELKVKYGAKEIFDETDDFNLSKAHALEISKAIVDADLGLSFKFQVRANTMDEELAANIRKMGAWLVFIGAESGNQRTLDGVQKKIKVEDIENCARMLSRQGIKVYGLFMGFNVWEEEDKLCFEGIEESRNTIRFAKSLIKKGYMHFMGFSLTNPFPFTRLFDIVTRHHVIDRAEGWTHWNDLWKLNLKLPGLTDKDWEMIKSEAGRVQALCALKSGMINVNTIYPLMRRGMRLVKFEMAKLFSVSK